MNHVSEMRRMDIVVRTRDNHSRLGGGSIKT
jgi:hypothetical protein